PDDDPVAEPHVPVAPLPPGSDEGDDHDRQERRALGAQLAFVEEQDQAGHEQDAAADADHAADDAGGEADRDGAREVPGTHQKIKRIAETTSRTAKAPETTLVGTRCWSAVPATTPPTAGTPI